ncbi:peptide chain release factor N(5)-glutamine methyltransferase [Aquirufa regiilacus]|uniref:peptide chain release factor N(5)-glutamine methyltransferase n=1 Tax=Aquirufa regiilacus TaxID=3024868 RepID=A0ABU3TT88_9BACT|nr:peptide chain release factor N(5)-glutamine methyltransferase [Aquirufa sp. LEOWEIH-7C]MDU0809081.1 peptide chain release factor N(5)-glutamine methyltransferase [Aquirufa sp. LEOWEIH-7C]
MSLVSVNALSQQIQQAIAAKYPANEARAIAHGYLNMVCGINTLDILLDKAVEEPRGFAEDLSRLAAGEPLQYVTGKAYFFDRLFSLNTATLIPRPETEELVSQVLNLIGNEKKRVLDIGTGSGCIAISLALEAPQAELSAWDVAPEAITKAKENADQLGAQVTFTQQDVFSWSGDSNTWDIIVSNPPYVLDTEKTEMEAHVLDHEPHLALFVSDEDPLVFYRVIGEMAKQRLTPDGFLCFEINRAFGEQNVALAKEQGFENIQLIKDFHGNDRMLIAQKPAH